MCLSLSDQSSLHNNCLDITAALLQQLYCHINIFIITIICSWYFLLYDCPLIISTDLSVQLSCQNVCLVKTFVLSKEPPVFKTNISFVETSVLIYRSLAFSNNRCLQRQSFLKGYLQMSCNNRSRIFSCITAFLS